MTLLNLIKDAEFLAVYDNKIYIADESCFKSKNKDKVYLNKNGVDVELSLLPVDIGSLWKVYVSDKEKELEKLVEKEIKKQKAIPAEEKLGSMCGNNVEYIKLLKSVLFELCPYLNERSDDEIANLFSKTKKSQKDFWLEFLESELKCGSSLQKNLELYSKNKKRSSKSKSSVKKIPDIISFEEFFFSKMKQKIDSYGAKGLVFMENKLYSIAQSTYKTIDKIQLGSKKYGIYRTDGGAGANFESNTFVKSIENIFEEYFLITAEHEAVKRRSELEKEFVQGDKDRERMILYNVLKHFEKNKTLDFGEFGLKSDDAQNRITVYLNVPEYALKTLSSDSYNKRCYLFPETKVAIDIRNEKGYSDPFLLGSAYSPFIAYGHGIDHKICMGYYSNHAITKMEYPLNIIKYLQDAKKIILQGYRGGAYPHRHINEIGGKVKEISKEELKKRNIPITNE